MRFYDSELEIKFINTETARMLARNNSAVQFIDKLYSVTCANGTKMELCGSVSLEIELGGTISR